MEDDLFKGCGIEIILPSDDAFLKVKETLTRIGVASRKEKTLFQSCHILHKRGRYAIVHFKELFILDGKTNTFKEDDEFRRNTIVKLLVQWGLVSLKDVVIDEERTIPMSHVKIISHKDKKDWNLVSKYSIGAKQ